jgi:hypothetical protein
MVRPLSGGRVSRAAWQVGEINAVLRGHYAYFGVAGNIRSLLKVYRATELRPPPQPPAGSSPILVMRRDRGTALA